jgi:hypothetical protein
MRNLPITLLSALILALTVGCNQSDTANASTEALERLYYGAKSANPDIAELKRNFMLLDIGSPSGTEWLYMCIAEKEQLAALLSYCDEHPSITVWGDMAEAQFSNPMGTLTIGGYPFTLHYGTFRKHLWDVFRQSVEYESGAGLVINLTDMQSTATLTVNETLDLNGSPQLSKVGTFTFPKQALLDTLAALGERVEFVSPNPPPLL